MDSIVTRQSANTLYGLGYRRSLRGGIIFDIRDKSKKEKSVGSIYYCFLLDGYVISTQIKKRLYFGIDIPQQFKSSDKAWLWIQQHAIAWREKNMVRDLSHILTSLRPKFKFYYFIREIRVQIIIIQMLSAIMLALFHVDGNMLFYISTKVLAIVLFSIAIFNLIVIFRDY